MSGPRQIKARPTCALCNKPVEDFTEEEATFTVRVTFVARCHGQTERVTVDREQLEDSRGISFGLAFMPKNRISAPPIRGLIGSG